MQVNKFFVIYFVTELGNDVELPFSQQIEWEKAAVILLKARAPELHLVLKTYSDADIVALRRQGRRLMENYLATPKLSIDTLLTAMRFALKMPAAPERDEPSNPVANLSFGLVNQQVYVIFYHTRVMHRYIYYHRYFAFFYFFVI